MLHWRKGWGSAFRSCVIGATLLSAFAAGAQPLPATGTVEPMFAPWEDVEGALVDLVAQARRQVLVQAYLLTSKKLAQALAAAQRRGIEVKVLLDEKQLQRAGSAAAEILAKAGIPVWIDSAYQNAHNKVMVIDAGTPGATVITGSFNFTWTAQHRNAENILILRNNPVLAARYAANWERHREQAQPYRK